MKSTFIQFVQKYITSKLPETRLYTLWNSEIEKDDFDKNKKECWEWFKKARKNKIRN